MPYQSTKRYGHELGLSCAFRQHKADSHCRHIHGYALAFRFVFETDELDGNNWVVDFGSLKSLKQVLEWTFDHKTLVAKDDPNMDWFNEARDRDLIELMVVDKTGCEAFAQIAFEMGEVWLRSNGYWPRVHLVSVEVSEHGANSAVYKGENLGDECPIV